MCNNQHMQTDLSGRVRFVYCLTGDELDTTFKLAERRAERGGYKDRTPHVVTNTSLLERHLMGIRSELAVSRILGGQANNDVLYKSNGQGRGDGDQGDTTILDWTVCVKYRTARGMDFALPNTDDSFTETLGVLVWPVDIKQREFEVVGWCTRKMFRLEHETLHFGRHLRSGIRWQKMLPIQQLISILATRREWLAIWQQQGKSAS